MYIIAYILNNTILWFYKKNESIYYNYVIPYKWTPKNYIKMHLKHMFYYTFLIHFYGLKLNYKKLFIIVY